MMVIETTLMVIIMMFAIQYLPNWVWRGYDDIAMNDEIMLMAMMIMTMMMKTMIWSKRPAVDGTSAMIKIILKPRATMIMTVSWWYFGKGYDDDDLDDDDDEEEDVWHH